MLLCVEETKLVSDVCMEGMIADAGHAWVAMGVSHLLTNTTTFGHTATTTGARFKEQGLKCRV